MKELIDKLGSYHLFNYLLPGIIFVVIAKAITTINLVQEDVVTGVFIYYFIGSIISRIGSLVLEPLLKKSKIVQLAPYEDFVKASKQDASIITLSEANNTYRTLAALSISLLATKTYDLLSIYCTSIVRYGPYVLIVVT